MSIEERGGMKIVGEIIDPSVVEAERKAEGIIEQAKMNEAIRVIDGLLAEVDSMSIAADRFSPTKKVLSAVDGHSLNPILPHLKEMKEQDYKREQLRRDFTTVRHEIIDAIMKLKIVIMDMEATKLPSSDEDAGTESPKA